MTSTQSLRYQVAARVLAGLQRRPWRREAVCSRRRLAALTMAVVGYMAEAHAPLADTASMLFDDFSGGRLDPAKWLAVEKNWGGQVGGVDYNGGVIAENVVLSGGRLKLIVTGNRYDGLLRGVNRDGSRRDDGKRVGASIATREYFGSGRYEVRMQIIPRLGVVSAMWTFHYQEIAGKGIVNHEIDVELPGRPTADAPPSFAFALMNTWTGEAEDEHSTRYVRLQQPLNDRQFHIYRFDWYSGSASEKPRIEFYIDDRLHATATSHVPFLRSRFYIGAWFPKYWAGEPDFSLDALEVDWVRITPFPGMNDEAGHETYPMSGLLKP